MGFDSQETFFSWIALKMFLGAFHKISRLFSFFCHFFVLFFCKISVPSFFRVLSGTISSALVKDAKNLKILSESHELGLPNGQVLFVYNQTPTHRTGLKMAAFTIGNGGRDRLYA